MKYSIELSKEKAHALKYFLIGYGIKYEPCECFNTIYMTIFATEKQAENINRFLEVNT